MNARFNALPADCQPKITMQPFSIAMALTPDTATEGMSACVIEAGALLRDQLIRDLSQLPEIADVRAARTVAEAAALLDPRTPPLVIVNLEQVRRADWPAIAGLKRRAPATRFVGFTILGDAAVMKRQAGRFCDAVVPLAIAPRKLLESVTRLATAMADGN